MTTKSAITGRLEYQWNTVIDYSSLEYDPDDPGPLPDGMQQDPILRGFLPALAEHCTDADRSPDNFMSSNTILCYNRNNLNVRVLPDCYLAFGVDAQAIRQRKMYVPWEVGKPPDFALEVGSESTKKQDVVEKRRIYAYIGIPEYWLFDPTGGDMYGQPLAGEMLTGGVYRPTELTREPDGILKGYSPVLGLYLCWDDGELRFYNPATESYLRTLRQERVAHDQTQAALQTEQSAHDQTRASLQTEQSAHDQTRAALQAEQAAREVERAAREAAEARAQRLEEQLRRQQPEN